MTYTCPKRPIPPPKKTQLAAIISAGVQLFEANGEKAIQLTFRSGKAGILYLRYKGVEFTTTGLHYVVFADGRIYDPITGPAGMEMREYYRLWATEILAGESPLIFEPDGKPLLLP